MAVDIIARGMAATADSNAEIARKISATDYDPTETYNKNDIVFYDGKLYVCTGTNVTGAFDPAKWSQIIISDELTAIINRLAQIDNPMLIKGVVATVGDLPQNAESGWVYFVGQEGDVEYDEYVYTEDDGWQHIGSAKVIVDSALSLTSANPVENRVITAALNTKLKSIAAAAAFDPEATYTTGDYMTLDGELFRCDPNGSSPYPNLFNITSATTGTGYQDGVCYYDSGTSGNIQTFITSNIAITGGTAYALTIRSNWPQVPQIEAAAFFDENNVEVGSRITFYGIPSYGLGTKNFTAPATAAYIRLCITKAGNYATETELRQTSTSTAKFVKTTIAAELDTKQDALTFDITPTADSNNPVTSNGIKLALDAKVNYDDIPTVSKAEYEAIGTEKYTNHKIYFIPDGDDVGANVQIFGWHVNPSESDPEDCVTYLEDAVGMTPAAMGATTFDYGSWKNAFFMPRPCMVKSNGKVDYYLDPNDYTKKLDGTASDIADASYDGNAMMEWPLIWWKYVAGEAEGEGSFYVSNVKIDNTYDCYCNVNCDNQIVEHFYTAIYNGTGTSKLRSISGVALTNANGNGGTTYAQESDRAMANNTTAKTEWFIDVWADRMLINGLLILMGKSLNTQAVFGRGLDTGSQAAKEAYVTGTLNDKGLFWGNISAGTSGVKVFGMENWYSCVWHRTAGLISGANSQYAYKMTWGTYDGTTATGYNTTATGYKTVGTRPATGYFNKATFGQFGYLPVVTSASSASTYYCDYYYDGTGFALVGGTAGGGAYGGASCVILYYGAGNAYWYFAAALTLKPLT